MVQQQQQSNESMLNLAHCRISLNPLTTVPSATSTYWTSTMPTTASVTLTILPSVKSHDLIDLTSGDRHDQRHRRGPSATGTGSSAWRRRANFERSRYRRRESRRSSRDRFSSSRDGRRRRRRSRRGHGRGDTTTRTRPCPRDPPGADRIRRGTVPRGT